MSRIRTNYKNTIFCCGVLLPIPHSILILFVGLFVFLNNPANAQQSDQAKDSSPVETQALSESITSDEWNWDSFEADDTPIDPNDSVQQTPQTAPTRRLSIDEVTSPDLEASPHQVYQLFKNIPSFEVIPSKIDTEMHPCGNCHQWVKSNLTPRKLDNTPHDNFELKHGLHGKGQFWCFTCHNSDGTGALKTLDGEPVDFKDAYIICSQCHVKQARDWAFGAHGKRLSNWQGKRQVFNCTVCHYQHSPSFKPRNAMAGPEIRQGLTRPAHWFPGQQGKTSLDNHGVNWSNRHE